MNDILNKFGPCGILCEKCFAYSAGSIKEHSRALKRDLGNFDVYASRFATLLNKPGFESYPAFKEVLDLLVSIECKGCRLESCRLFAACRVRDCAKEHRVDFCYQCAEFPCTGTGFDEHLYKRSVIINNRIREIGLDNYYNEVKDKPRY